MTALLVALAFACGLCGGVALTKVKRRGPVNVVRGMLLPHPEDERWRGPEACIYEYLCIGGYRLGVVRACPKHGHLWIEGDQHYGAGRYVRALALAQRERKALAAALGDS